MTVTPIAPSHAADTAIRSAAETPQSTTSSAATAGRTLPQDVVTLSDAAKQSMQSVDTDGPGK